MKNVNRIDTLRGAYEAPRCDMVEICAERGLCLSEAPRCDMVEICAERGLCLSYGAGHGGFEEDDYSGWQN